MGREGQPADQHRPREQALGGPCSYSSAKEALPYCPFLRPRPPARPAFRASALRSSGVIFLIRALPPFRPSATAAGSFLFGTCIG